jgi:hypothetical protein
MGRRLSLSKPVDAPFLERCAIMKNPKKLVLKAANCPCKCLPGVKQSLIFEMGHFTAKLSLFSFTLSVNYDKI